MRASFADWMDSLETRGSDAFVHEACLSATFFSSPHLPQQVLPLTHFILVQGLAAIAASRSEPPPCIAQTWSAGHMPRFAASGATNGSTEALRCKNRAFMLKTQA